MNPSIRSRSIQIVSQRGTVEINLYRHPHVGDQPKAYKIDAARLSNGTRFKLDMLLNKSRFPSFMIFRTFIMTNAVWIGRVDNL